MIGSKIGKKSDGHLSSTIGNSNVSRIEKSKTQAAENVNRSKIKKIQAANPMISNYSQNLFKSERENKFYGK